MTCYSSEQKTKGKFSVYKIPPLNFLFNLLFLIRSAQQTYSMPHSYCTYDTCMLLSSTYMNKQVKGISKLKDLLHSKRDNSSLQNERTFFFLPTVPSDPESGKKCKHSKLSQIIQTN